MLKQILLAGTAVAALIAASPAGAATYYSGQTTLAHTGSEVSNGFTAPANAQVYFNASVYNTGDTFGATIDVDGVTKPFYQSGSVAFLLDGDGSHTFSILDTSGRGGVTFDISTTSSAAPEPMGWSLMLGGVAGLGGMLRRNRRLCGMV